MEIIVACSLIVRLKNEDAEQFGKSKNDKWKQAGIIGAAALTGGSLVAITGGMGSLSLYIQIYIFFSRVPPPIFLGHKQCYKFTID